VAHGDNAVALPRDMVAELEETGNTSANMWRQVLAAMETLREFRPR
jgi:hypothetical protein